MNVNKLIYYSQRRQEGDRERKEEIKQSVPSDKCEYGFTGSCGISFPGNSSEQKRSADPRLTWRSKTTRGPGGPQLPGTRCDPSPAPWQALVAKAGGPPCHSSSSIPRVQLLVEWALKAV